MVIRKITLKLFLFLIVLLTFNTLNAQTNVSGIISTNTTWTKIGSPYHITGNVLVNSGVTLTIEPGVNIKVNGNYYIKVEGILDAVGLNNSKITFETNLSNPTKTSWAGIQIRPTGGSVINNDLTYSSGSRIKYVVIKNAEKGIYVYNTGLYVVNAEFSDNNYGIEFRSTDNVLIDNCTFTNNNYGTYTEYESYDTDPTSSIQNTFIQNSSFIYNTIGNYFFLNQRDFKNLNVNNNIYKQNQKGIVFSGGGYGSRVFSTSIRQNNFIDNTNIGLEIGQIYGEGSGNGLPAYPLIVEKNSFIRNSVKWSYGGGISGVTIKFVNNIISNPNGIGLTIIGQTSRNDLFNNNYIYSNVNAITIQGQYGNSYLPSNKTFSSNTIIGNSFSALIKTKGSGMAFTNNNFITSQTQTVLQIEDANTVNAVNNYWGTTNLPIIEKMIYDRNENFELGSATITSVLNTKNESAPVTTPINIVKTLSSGRVVLTWTANTESDIAGYKVYYGGFTGYSYTNSVNAGNVLTYTLPVGVGIDDDIAVTAYDASKDGTDDQFDGNESWYSPANKMPEAPADLKIEAASKRIKLNWTASTSTGVNAYNVYRSTNGTTYAKVGSTVSANFIDRGLTAQTKYYYKISAIDSLDLSYDNYGLESQFSDIVSATPNNITYVSTSGSDSNIGSITSPKLKISAAVTEAITGDSILINDGTYLDNINFLNKTLSFIGINGAAKVIIKPLLSSHIFFIENAGNTLFNGLTFSNASARVGGSAILEKLSSPIIESCIFKDNGASGGVISTQSGTFTMNNCLAYGNSPNTFFELSNSVSSDASINHFTYIGNSGQLFNSGNSTYVANFKNSILWDSSNIVYSGIISVENSIIKGGFPGTTSNLEEHPRFLDSLNNDFRLADYSPAIGLGRSILGINKDILGMDRSGPAGFKPDAGAYESMYNHPSPYVVADSSINGMINFKFNLTGLNSLKKIYVYKGLTSQPSAKYQTINPSIVFTDSLNQEFNKPIYYRFSSVDLSDIESGFSNEIKTISFTSPKLKAPLNLSLKIDTNITFSWSKIAGASLYTLQFSKDSIFSTELTEKIVADTFFVQTNLTHNAKYFWKVKSSNGKAYSKWSSIFNFKTFISPPKLINVKAGNKIDTLLWSTNSNKNIKYFKIYRDTILNPTKLLDSISGKLSTYIDKSTLQLNRKYYYRMVTGNFENEESVFSNDLSAIPFNSSPSVKKFENKTFNNVGEYNFIRATYSSYGSKDSDGLITKYEWFVNDSLVNSTDTIFVNYYKQGTNKLMLRVTDNDGGKDSTIAYISLSSFTKAFKGAFLGGITALNPNIIYAADSNFDPINGASVSLVNRTGNSIFPLVVSSKIFTTPSVTADSSVFITSGSSLNGFNKTGAPLWPTIPLGGLSLVTPTIDSQFDRIYLGVSNKNFFAIDSKTGKVAWNIISDAPINASAVITGDRKLIFTSDNGTIYGFDIRTNIIQQSAKWQVNLNEIITKSPAVDQNNNLILGTLSGKILKVKLNDNSTVSTVWSSNLGSPIESSPVIDANGFIYIGTNKGDFYRINPENGAIVWKYESGYSIKSTPAISEFGNIYFANVNGVITAIDLNKVVKWKYNAEEPISANILYIQNMVYGGTENGKFFGIYDNPKTNTLNAGISTIKGDKSISYSVENKLASIKSLNSNIFFNEQNKGLDKPNLDLPIQMVGVNDPSTNLGVADKEPVWGTFQGNYRRTGSKAFDCPPSTITYSGSLVICEGNSIVLTASEGISYLWSTGESSRTITVNKAGNYSVTVTSLNGCSLSSTSVSVKTIALPQVSISVDGSNLFVQGSTVKISSTVTTDGTFQWYKDDVLIPGAVGNTLLGSQSGTYKLRFLNSSGCFAFSKEIILTSLFSLSPTNYKISIFGESCSKNNDGKISIIASQPYKYKATLMKGQAVISTNDFTGFLNLEKLPADKYSLCFTIEGQPDYKQCFDIVISEPKDLSVYSQLNPANNILKLALSGGSSYRISLNGETFTSFGSTYDLALKNGWNKVSIVTDKECQGVFQEEIFVNEKVLVYPNPFTDILNLKINQEENPTILIMVYDGAGFPVYRASHSVQNGLVSLDLSRLDSGYYTIAIGKEVYKVLKK